MLTGISLAPMGAAGSLQLDHGEAEVPLGRLIQPEPETTEPDGGCQTTKRGVEAWLGKHWVPTQPDLEWSPNHWFPLSDCRWQAS